jgi:biopolymer transport protein ExbB/TolQ
MANNIDRAIKLCSAAFLAALPRVIKAGLMRANKGPEEIQNAVEEATLEIVPIVTKRTTVLQQIANIATLLGLLGTILGLIAAFDALKNPNIPADQRQSMLAGGIAMAMNTTAFGLIVAIPCLVAQVFLTSVTKKIIDEID